MALWVICYLNIPISEWQSNVACQEGYMFCCWYIGNRVLILMRRANPVFFRMSHMDVGLTVDKRNGFSYNPSVFNLVTFSNLTLYHMIWHSLLIFSFLFSESSRKWKQKGRLVIVKSLKDEVFTQQSRVKATATHALQSYTPPCVTKSERHRPMLVSLMVLKHGG